MGGAACRSVARADVLLRLGREMEMMREVDGCYERSRMEGNDEMGCRWVRR